MSKKREGISALFESQGLHVRERVVLVRDPHLGKGSSTGHLKGRHASQQMKQVAEGADTQLRTLCQRGVVPS